MRKDDGQYLTHGMETCIAPRLTLSKYWATFYAKTPKLIEPTTPIDAQLKSERTTNLR